MSLDGPLLDLAHVSKRYDSPGAGSLPVLDDISLQVNRGESVAIIGPSGSGKSTLLHLMGALDHPSSGRVCLNGDDLSQLNDTQLASIRNRQLGFVFQSHYLLPQCTVLENVLVPTLARKRAEEDTSQAGRQEPAAIRAERLLKRVGLSERLNHRPGQLSGGERQRVAVVRALINRPQLLLADEPTGALDQRTSRDMGQLLVELNTEEKVALIVVTHSLELAQSMSRLLVLKRGCLTPFRET